MFDYRQSYIIKFFEKSISISNITDSMALLTNKVLEELKQEYKYIHLGMVQIAIKPLTTEGLNASLLACLRDKQHNKFNDSLFGIMNQTYVLDQCISIVFLSILLICMILVSKKL